MAEFSFPWAALVAGDGGPSAYTLAVVEGTNKFLSNINPTTSGVVYWTETPNANLLAPSTPGGGIVRIASGVGLVEGWVYTSDANVDFDINAAPGNASATDIIVLQRVVASQTVRLARIAGAAASKAVLTQTAATWEIPIVDVVLDGAGALASITDARKLALPPGTIVAIDERNPTGLGTIIFSDIPPLFSALRIEARIRASGGAGTVETLFTTLDTSLNYDWLRHQVNSTPGSSTVSNTGDSSFDFPQYTGVGGTANYFDGFEMIFPAYTSTGFKSVICQYSLFEAGAPFSTVEAFGWWKSIKAIDRVIFNPTINGLVTGSKIVLYGVA
jgi:hypothetical protein